MTNDTNYQDAVTGRMQSDAQVLKEQGLTEQMLEEMTQEQLFDLYVEQLIKEKGVEPSDRLRAVLKEKLSNEINYLVATELPEEAIDRIGEENLSEEEIAGIIEQSGIDMEEIFEQAMRGFRVKYLREGEE